MSRAWAQWVQDIDKLLKLPAEWDCPLEILQKCPKVRPVRENVAVPGHLQPCMTKKQKNPVETTGDFLENIQVGTFVAV